MATPYEDRLLPAPRPNPGDEPFFEAAVQRLLLIKHCPDCGRPHWYPRAVCPFCLSDRLEWCQAAGGGVIHTFSVTRRAGPPPYAIAYVMLDEGVAMMTNIVDCDLDALRIGQRVRLVFKPTQDGGPPVPCFVPA